MPPQPTSIQNISTVKKLKRIQSLDVLKGTVMIIMALDHVRDYFHADSFIYDPADLTKTNVLLFFTRWITHFCAPVFVLLAGTSAFLSGRKKSKKELSLFLLKRGLWLIFLDVVIVNFAWYFDIHFATISLGVIWAIGVSMIFLAGLIFLKKEIILITGLVLIFTHNLFDNVHVTGNNLQAFLWNILHERKVVTFFNTEIKSSYPVLPWIGVMAVGYLLGSIYTADFDALKRKRILIYTGIASLLLFILLRGINVYGNFLPWSHQSSPVFTFLSFINVTKYPPSLDYLLITIGGALLFLAFAEKPLNKLTEIISVYGKVPLFYYVIHLYIIHVLAILAAAAKGFSASDMISIHTSIHTVPQLEGYGFQLWTVYIIWIMLVVAMYPLCKWYGSFKIKHKESWWVSYL